MNHNSPPTLARIFATEAHQGQVRKYTGEPYLNHPSIVAAIVQRYGGSELEIAGAYLHDVVEDTDVTLEQIRTAFGIDVEEVVEGLTDVSTPEDGNRKTRKAFDREHLGAANRSAQFVKLADMIANALDIRKHDPKFAETYLEEMRLLLPELSKVSGTKLYDICEIVIRKPDPELDAFIDEYLAEEEAVNE